MNPARRHLWQSRVVVVVLFPFVTPWFVVVEAMTAAWQSMRAQWLEAVDAWRNGL